MLLVLGSDRAVRRDPVSSDDALYVGRSTVLRTAPNSALASTKQSGHGCPKTRDLALERLVFPPQTRLRLP
ncbi:uncharacterized protein SOCE26_090850 [Sorangium cellulosum]|uniref:Uncharacterized protein n=1 Tax=Sorangium cellulosum TaxID=56 RepID=A0A2L0F7P9_SORCE|nr:uncharacterized protein SOCE26_090850 [Sorangium cellulosum]